MKVHIKPLAIASSVNLANTSRVEMPVSSNLSISSVIDALELFKEKKLLNVSVIFTDEGCCVEFIFARK